MKSLFVMQSTDDNRVTGSILIVDNYERKYIALNNVKLYLFLLM